MSDSVFGKPDWAPDSSFGELLWWDSLPRALKMAGVEKEVVDALEAEYHQKKIEQETADQDDLADQ